MQTLKVVSGSNPPCRQSSSYPQLMQFKSFLRQMYQTESLSAYMPIKIVMDSESKNRTIITNNNDEQTNSEIM